MTDPNLIPPAASVGDAATVAPASVGDAATLTAGASSAATVAAPPVAPPGFVIERELGRGGMGVVYLARQAGLNRPVALKMVLGDGRIDRKHLIRFLAEAEAVASVRHPNVVEVYQYGESGGRPFLALEFCPGGSLADGLKDGPLEPSLAAETAAAVAAGVAAAHAQGIVHRDLKPHNVLVGADGQPKVTDFGLAKRAAGDSELTKTNAVMGTPAYMAPEQAQGGAKFVGPAADVWALGVVLYELLSGARPFSGDDAWSLLAAVMKAEAVPVRRKVPGVPCDLALICQKCLEKEPRDRYPTAAELAADLRRFLAGEPVTVRPPGAAERFIKWVRRNKAVSAALAAAALALVLGTAVSAWQAVRASGEAGRADREAKAARDSADEAKAQAAEARRAAARLATTEGLRRADAGSTFEAVAWFLESARLAPGDADIERAARQRVATHLRYGSAPTLTSTIAVHTSPPDILWGGLVVSADGRRMVTCGQTNTRPEPVLRVWDVATGRAVSPLVALPPGNASAVALAPDGSSVLTVGHDGAGRLWRTADGRALGAPLRHDKPIEPTRIAFSPDGRRVATADERTVRVWDARTGRAVAGPLAHEAPVTAVRFAADGRLAVAAGPTVHLWDAETGRPAGDAIRAPAPTDGNWPAVRIAWSADGSRLLIPRGGTVSVWDVSGRGPRLVTAWQERIDGPDPLAWAQSLWMRSVHALSPDGRRALTASPDGVIVRELSSGRLTAVPLRLASAPVAVAFSPDGRRFALGYRDGSQGVVRVWDAATGEPVTPPLAQDGGATPVFTADGRELVAASQYSVYVWDLAGAGRPVVRAGAPVAPFADPLGQQSGWFRVASDRGAMEARSADGRVAALAADSQEPASYGRFAPDGRFVLTTDDLKYRGAHRHARVWDAATGRALSPLLANAGGIKTADFSPDSTAVLTKPEERQARVWEAATGLALTPPLRAPAAARVPGLTIDGAAFSPDGRAAVATWARFIKSEGMKGEWRPEEWVWDLSPDERPLSDLDALARTLSGATAAGGAVPVLSQERMDLWRDFRGRYPGAFAVPPEAVRGWHRAEADAAGRDGDAFAEVFHLRRLVALAPDDTDARRRLDALDRAAPPPHPAGAAIPAAQP